jgi:hypothetical protein
LLTAVERRRLVVPVNAVISTNEKETTRARKKDEPEALDQRLLANVDALPLARLLPLDLLVDGSFEGFLTRGGDGGRGGGLGLELGNKGGVELCLVKGQ